jgi:hypothetical protein
MSFFQRVISSVVGAHDCKTAFRIMFQSTDTSVSPKMNKNA